MHLGCQKPTEKLYFYILVVSYFTVSTVIEDGRVLVLFYHSVMYNLRKFIYLSEYVSLPVKWVNNEYLLWFTFIVSLC